MERDLGLIIKLEGERGDVLASIADTNNYLGPLLPLDEGSPSALLKYIDLYGDTTFNQLQMADFLDEWSRLYSLATSDAERKMLRAVENLGRKCASEAHLYLKFYGD